MLLQVTREVQENYCYGTSAKYNISVLILLFTHFDESTLSQSCKKLNNEIIIY